jgi:hypothetical protein
MLENQLKTLAYIWAYTLFLKLLLLFSLGCWFGMGDFPEYFHC